MNDTLESIKPINNRPSNSELSFIYGRDPSILAYGRRPFPIEETKKDLDFLYEDEVQASTSDISSVPSMSTLGDTIKVYLRLRPFPRNMKVSQQQKEAYKIINSNTLLTKLPSIENNTSSLKRLRASDTISRKFTFSDTFGPETTQLQLFEQAVKQQMNDFLNGQSATVMSYGTTNAGKSYTLQGTTVSPGIIPRGLEYVFCNINPRPTPCYKPVHNTDVTSLDAGASAYEMELKTKLLAFSSTDKNKCIQAYRGMQQLLHDESPMKLSKTSDANYSVWVSFAEIYNETIFDLLSNDCQKKRPSLKLATDNKGKAFIKNLKMVCVNSGSEAYQLLMAGQDNLKIAATALNTRSSRSHCIFTIKLLKFFVENKPNDVEVSTFSFCDLAGSERLKKTLNAGERLKEAQNINTSLLVLGRCLKSIFDVQSAKSKHEVTGPFRESKLTRLFQPALSGKEHIALIVNVNPVPNLYNETQNVLNFSAIAKQIIIQPVTYKKKTSNSRFSQIVSQSVMTVTDWDAIDLESIGEEPSPRATERVEYVHVEDYDEVIQLNEKLKKEVAQLKIAALNSDFEIRQEMSNIYTAMIANLEANFKNRLQDAEEQQEDMLAWSVKHVEDYYKEKLSLLSSRKRSRIDNGDDSDDEVDMAELEAENVQLTTKVESLKKSVKELRGAKEELLIKNNQNAFELSLVKKDLQNCRNLLHAAQNDIGCGDQAEKVIEELKTQLMARDEQIKSLKVYLNEAKEEFIRITKVEAELEKCVKTKDEQLVELSEKMNDLMEQFENSNLCLAETTKTVETLEEKLDQYANNLATAEENLQNSEDKLNKSTANYLVILKENEELKKVIGEEISRSKIAADKCNCEEQVTELEKLKRELSQVTVEAEDLKVKISAKDETIDALNSKLMDSENENTSIKRKLAQNKDHSKFLREELDSTKATIGDITEQINSLKRAQEVEATTTNTLCPMSFVNEGGTIDCENLVLVKEENIKNENVSSMIDNNEENNRESQTISGNEIHSTISNSRRSDQEISEKLEQLTIEYNDLKTQFSNSELRVEGLCKELDEARQELDKAKKDFKSVKTSFEVSETEILEKKDLVKSITNALRISETELAKAMQELEATRGEKEVLEKKIGECEKIAERLRGDLEESVNKNKENSEVSEEYCKNIAVLEEQLSKTFENFEEISTKRLTEHENRIKKFEKDVSAAKERDLIKNQLLDSHIQRISKLKKDIAEAANLREKLTALEDKMKICEEEKEKLEKQLDENFDKILSLENELQASSIREQDKENETISLQKEIKNMIQLSANDSRRDIEMEKEVKKTLRELTAVQKALADSEAAFKVHEKSSAEKILLLEMQVKTFEKNASYLAMLQECAEKRQAESEQLRNLNEGLRQEIELKHQELISFNKNRDDTVQRYETLVKQLQEEVERTKREVSRYQELFLRQSTPTPRKEEIRKLRDELSTKTSLLEQVQAKLKKSQSMREDTENINTSDDENLPTNTCRTRRRGKNIASVFTHNDVSIIELSGSESKRVTRRTALPPPATVPSVEKRKPRKKKLFATTEDTCVDVEPTETTTPRSIVRSPLAATRSLRTRRK